MDIQDITPHGARVLVDTTEVTETASGIIIADGGHRTPVKGIVLRAGNASVFKEGQTLFFRRYSIDELKYRDETGDKSLFVVEDGDVVAVWDKKL